MEFELGESRTLYKSTIERFVGSFDSLVRKAQRNEPAGFSRARWSAMAGLGFLHLPVAETAGGLGGDAADCAVVAQALGYGVAPEPWLECGFWPALLLQGRAQDEGIASGERVCAVAWSEPGFDGTWVPQTTMAHRSGERYHLSGRKHLVLGAASAEVFLVTANDRGRTVCFLVARDQPGLSIEPYRIVDGSNAAVLHLDRVTVTSTDLVASQASFEESIVAVMLMAAAEMVGLARRLFDETLAYVKTREQFGQAIGRFQVIQHRMVDHYVSLEKASSTLLWALDEGWSNGPAAIAGAKAFIADLARTIAHDAVQLHGGMGITDELVVSHALKRIALLSRLLADPVHGFHLYERFACNDAR